MYASVCLRPTLHFSYFLAVAHLKTVICSAGRPKYLYNISVHHPCIPNHSIVHGKVCAPCVEFGVVCAAFPPIESSLVYFVVSAATYDIVSELKALLFLVTFGHFTSNIVSEQCSR